LRDRAESKVQVTKGCGFEMKGNKKEGPLANFGPDAIPSDEDVPLEEGQMPEGIEEKVLEEIGSLQYKAIMKRLDEIEKNLGEKLDELLKKKGKK